MDTKEAVEPLAWSLPEGRAVAVQGGQGRRVVRRQVERRALL